jgi:hypothetical protein
MVTDYKPSFGEFVTNPHASDLNPTRHGYFVEIIHRTGRCNKGDWFRCTDGVGHFWECGEVQPFEITEKMRRQDEEEALIEDAYREHTDIRP